MPRTVMNQPAWVKILHFPQESTPTPLTAFEIIYGLGRNRGFGRDRSWREWPAAFCLLAWIGAGSLGAMLCWWAVAGHFAFSRQADAYVSTVVNGWASHNEVINHAVYIASQTDVLTGALLVALVIYAWFSNAAEDARARLLLGFGAVLVSAVASRLLQVSLPLRLRPMHAFDSGFLPLPGIDPTLASHWGSFPSDHAALFFALVAVIWQRSRWLGLLAVCSALFGVLPRLYLGLHYLSDVVAGAMLGMAVVFMAERFGPRTLARWGVAWEQRMPGLFYGVAFLMSFEVATLFEDIRQVGRGVPAVLTQLGL